MAGRHTVKLELTLDQMNLVQGVLQDAETERIEAIKERAKYTNTLENRKFKALLTRQAEDLRGVIDQL